jgi:ADP-ribose pyrophosphatase YjhB (NUDIX family)
VWKAAFRLLDNLWLSLQSLMAGMSGKQKIQRTAAYALLQDQDRILLCRLTGGPVEGKWTLPGGGVEFGEHPEEAVVREVAEETGLEVVVNRLEKVNSHVDENDLAYYHHVQLIYSADVVGGEIRNEVDGSTDGAEWFPIKEVEHLSRVSLVDVGLSALIEMDAK